MNEYTTFNYFVIPGDRYINAKLYVRTVDNITYSAYIHEYGEFFNEQAYVCLTGEIIRTRDTVEVGTTLGWFNLSESQYMILYRLLLGIITFTPAKQYY